MAERSYIIPAKEAPIGMIVSLCRMDKPEFKVLGRCPVSNRVIMQHVETKHYISIHKNFEVVYVKGKF